MQHRRHPPRDLRARARASMSACASERTGEPAARAAQHGYHGVHSFDAPSQATTDRAFVFGRSKVGIVRCCMCGIPSRVAGSEKDGIIRILAALLHLGNIEFTGASLSAGTAEQRATHRTACTLHCRAACR
jgi:hypothetical protein